ncbi:MAG TPA: hypothetical protein VEV87_05305 [Chitinophagaceae bacterium]|nr:hypothetical protein [Chitinophagaceae bacterium]
MRIFLKPGSGYFLLAIFFLSCNMVKEDLAANEGGNPIEGSWKLITGTLIEKGDTVVTDYTKNVSFIKIINDDHFAFMHHDLKKGKDSPAVFSSGGGSYTLKDSSYTEHLEYCTAREWEGHDFTFTVDVREDTLIQSGIERIDSLGINRLNIEKYIRVKK